MSTFQILSFHHQMQPPFELRIRLLLLLLPLEHKPTVQISWTSAAPMEYKITVYSFYELQNENLCHNRLNQQFKNWIGLPWDKYSWFAFVRGQPSKGRHQSYSLPNFKKKLPEIEKKFVGEGGGETDCLPGAPPLDRPMVKFDVISWSSPAIFFCCHHLIFNISWAKITFTY